MSFLQQHVQEDLAQLTRILGKSVDDTINIFHLVLCSLLQAPQQEPGQCKKSHLPCQPGAVFEGLWPCRHFADKPFPTAVAELKRKIESLKLVSCCREGRIFGCLLLSVEYVGFARFGAVNNSENELLTK